MVFAVEDKHSAEPVVDRCSAAVMDAEPVEDRRSAIRHAEDTDARGLPPRGAGTDAGAGARGVVVLPALEETSSEYDVLTSYRQRVTVRLLIIV